MRKIRLGGEVYELDEVDDRHLLMRIKYQVDLSLDTVNNKLSQIKGMAHMADTQQYQMLQKQKRTLSRDSQAVQIRLSEINAQRKSSLENYFIEVAKEVLDEFKFNEIMDAAKLRSKF